MRRELLIWSFFIMCLVALSACENTFTSKAGDLKQEKQLFKDTYDIGTKSSRKGHQGTYGKIHEVHHLRIFQKAKAIYGGASDLKRPRPSHSSAACSVLLKPPTLFLPAVVKHVAVGIVLIFVLF